MTAAGFLRAGWAALACPSDCGTSPAERGVPAGGKHANLGKIVEE